MKKSYIIALLSVLICMKTTAQNISRPTHFVIFTTEGGRIDCALENKPKVVIDEERITIVDDKLILEYDIDYIHKYRLGKLDDDGIQDATMAGDGSVIWDAGTILLSNFAPNEQVYVSGINGLIHKNIRTDMQGNATIQTADLPKDNVYIIKVSKQSFKFIKR